MNADLELDCRGMICPRPVIELARHADDAAAAYDVPAWCRMRGHEYVGVDHAADGVARYLVRRTAPPGR
jgi:tRNA 2-thiouridine synthesizing protein A/cysteine desulfurase